MRCVIFAAVLLAAATAEADPQQFLGRTITDVQVRIAGVQANEAGVLELIDTHVGEALTMHDVRGTIDHLVGLSRFEDVRVLAAGTDQGVALTWELTPVRRIAKITVTGNAVLPAGAIRTELNERFGTQPSANRVADMVARLQSFYADRGFPRASILPRVESDEPAPELSGSSWPSGRRAHDGRSASVTSTLLDPAAHGSTTDLQAGRPFDQVALDARMASCEESLRQRGHYQSACVSRTCRRGGSIGGGDGGRRARPHVSLSLPETRCPTATATAVPIAPAPSTRICSKTPASGSRTAA